MTGELAVEVEEPASKAYENKVANKMRLMISPRQIILSPNQILKRKDTCELNDGIYSTNMRCTANL